jgi:signal transduction histidine kinase
MTAARMPCHDDPSAIVESEPDVSEERFQDGDARSWTRLDELQDQLPTALDAWDYRTLFNETPQPLWYEDWSAVKQRAEAIDWPAGVDIEQYLLSNDSLLHELYHLTRIVDMNAAAVAFYRASNREEILGRLFDETPRGSKEATARILSDLLSGICGMDWVLEGPPDENERARWVRAVWYMPPSARADWSRLVYSVQDVTAQKLAEEALARAKAEADAASRAKSEFLANVSHELRTPLNAIAGFSELLMEEKLGGLGHDAYREYARYIRDGGEHLLDLINDLLDLSRIDAGVAALKVDGIDVRDVVEGAVRIVHDKARRSGLHLSVEMPKTPLSIVADARKLRQIVVNLLSNAVKYTQPGGTVTVACESLGKQGVSIAVHDTGPGIDADDMLLAMERFGRIERPGVSPNDGVGLGLPLTKALVELHGGSFHLDSTPGQGTVATVVLPPEPTTASLPL